MAGRTASIVLVGAVCSVLVACSAQAPERSAPADAAPAAASPAAGPPVAATLLDVFPAAPERDLVVNNCGSCHNTACAAIGQRPAARWDALLTAHRDRLSGVDLDKVFAYLRTHFNDGTAEPKIAPALLEGGCTPF